MIAAIALGANLGEPLSVLSRATRCIARLPNSKLIARSSVYRSRPQGPSRQADYMNGVILVETGLAAMALLAQLQRIERKLGRRQGVRQGLRWGPRCIDLDIISYGNRSLRSKRLTIPHLSVAVRPFVLKPLAEIAPRLVLPGIGEVCDAAAAFKDDKSCCKIGYTL